MNVWIMNARKCRITSLHCFTPHLLLEKRLSKWRRCLATSAQKLFEFFVLRLFFTLVFTIRAIVSCKIRLSGSWEIRNLYVLCLSQQFSSLFHINLSLSWSAFILFCRKIKAFLSVHFAQSNVHFFRFL